MSSLSQKSLPFSKHYLVPILLLLLMYVAFAGASLFSSSTAVWLNYIWIPSGVALAVMLLSGARVWPAVFIGTILLNLMNQYLPGTPLGTTQPNFLLNLLVSASSATVEPLLAFYLLYKYLDFDPAINRLRDLFSLVNTLILVSLVSAMSADMLAYWGGVHEFSGLGRVLAHTWQRNALSYLIITPAILCFFYYEPIRWTHLRKLEAITLSGLLAFLCAFVFFDAFPVSRDFILQPKAFMLFPVAMWAALSFNQRGSSWSVLLIAFAAMIGGTERFGVYAEEFVREDSVNYWLFMLLLSATAGALSALNVGRIRSQAALKDQLHLYDTLLYAQADVGEGVAIIEDGKIIYGNEALWRICGYQPHDIPYGADFFSLIHPVDRERVRLAYMQRMDGSHSPRRYDSMALGKNGQPVPVEIAAASFRDESGRVVILMIDISKRKQAEAALMQSQAQYQELVESVQAVVCRTDPYGRFTFVSHEAEALLGYPLLDWTNTENFWKNNIHPDDRQWVSELYTNEAMKLQSYHLDYRMVAREGRVVWVQHMVKVIANKTGLRPMELVGVMLDITERKEAEAGLRLSRQVFDHTAEGILITDANFHVLEVNLAYTKITGYQRDEVIGRPLKVLSTGLHDRKYYDSIWHRIETHGQWVGEILNLRKNGDKYPEWLSISAVNDHQGVIQNYVAVLSDITQRKRSEERLQFLANHDALTHLPNRSLMHERGELAVIRANRNQTKIAVLFIDLDRFKIINDTLGHQTGDVLLQEVAKRLRECLRESDLVARQGGDEFVVIVESFENAQYLSSVARKIMSVLGQPLILMNQELYVSASIGISVYPEDGVDIFTLLKHADVAMYRAKESGKNTFHFYAAEGNTHSVELLALENSLRRAVERDELLLYYQPKVDLRTHEIVGAEALIRWQHLDLGLLSPSQFIALAEETGLIIDIGAWVLQQACKHAQAWQSMVKNNVTIAVNLSARQFREEALRNTIADALSESGLSPECLELEITESMIMQNADRASLLLEHFRALGTHVLIDDFGTGYSSLGYLKQFPIDSLKIDRSFVRDIPDDKDDMAITQAIIAMAHSLNMKVVAEGVETQAQFDFLKQQGCDHVQGYIYSEPLPHGEFIKLLKSQPIKQWQSLTRTLTLVS